MCPSDYGLNRVYGLSYVQQRVNIAGPRLLSLERPACKVGPLLASEKLAGKEFLTLI